MGGGGSWPFKNVSLAESGGGGGGAGGERPFIKVYCGGGGGSWPF